MAKKDDNKWIIFLIIGGILIFGYTQGWFKGSGGTFSTTNNYINPQVPNNPTQDASYTNILSFNPTTFCVGSVVTGKIDTNIPFGVCTLFVNVGLGWQAAKNFNLDASGDVTDSDEINSAGTATFRAICCDSKGNCKTSNEVTLTSNNCQNSCTDSDGGQEFYIGGQVTTKLGTVHDTCQPNGMDLLEFYCDAFGNQASTGIGCPYGCTQGTVGGYCNTQSNGNQGGSTPQNMPCELIVLPGDQRDCDQGTITQGRNYYCKFIPATISRAASCEETPLDNCNDICLNDGAGLGICGDAFAHSPCGTGYHFQNSDGYSGDQYCPLNSLHTHDWCCCK